MVAVGLSRDEVLVQWREDVRTRAVLALVITIAVVLLVLLLLRSLGRRDASEAALRVSEQRFDLAVRGTCDGLWDWDMVADRVWFSPRCCELLGYKAVEEFSSDYDDYFSRIHAEDGERRALALEQHLKEGKPYDVEYRLRLKGGAYRWFRVRGQAIRNAAGEPIRMAGSISDIDSQRRAETALVEALDNLRESEGRLSSLIENVPGVIYRSVFDGRWTETFVNHALGELTGYPPTDFVAGGPRSFASIIHPDDRDHVARTIEESVRKHTPFAVEYRIIHRSGGAKMGVGPRPRHLRRGRPRPVSRRLHLRYHRPQAGRGRIAAGERCGRGGQPGEVAIPRPYEPRAAHAAQCHHRLFRGHEGRAVRRDGLGPIPQLRLRYPRERHPLLG